MTSLFQTLAQAQAEKPIPDETGEIDVSPASILERVDNMLDGFLKILPNLAIGIIVFIGFIFLGKGLKALARKSMGEKRKSLSTVLERIIGVVILLLGLLVATAIIAPSVKPADLLATLGVGGVAIGFAFKDILQNFLAGILILVRQPFRTGDQIVVSGHEGTVQSIETRSTIIKTYDGKQIVIPNGQIYMTAVVVNTAYDSRRTQYDVGIGCNDSMEKAHEILLETLKNTQGVLSDPAPDVRAVGLGDFANILRCRWWTDSEQASVMKVQDQVITYVEAALTKNAIDMPYPTHVHLFHDQTEENDGIRAKQREGWPSDGNDPKTRRIADSLDKNQKSPSPENSPNKS